MEAQRRPPWRDPPQQRSGRPAQSSIPRKRPAQDAQEEAWVAGEDRFVLQQAKKKAEIRVKEGRAKPIDWLAVTLRFIDPARNPFDDEIQDSELDIVDPEGVFEGLNDAQLANLEKDIDHYFTLEQNLMNRDFWETMLIICKDRRQRTQATGPEVRIMGSVSTEVDRMFGAKSYDELEKVEKQIETKLKSNEAIDVDYWEHLLRSLKSWKAKAKMKRVSQSIVTSQLQGLRKQQEEEALKIQSRLAQALNLPERQADGDAVKTLDTTSSLFKVLDPEPMLKVRVEDKNLETQEERAFLDKIASERRKILKLGFIPAKRKSGSAVPSASTDQLNPINIASRTNKTHSDDVSQTNSALYDREVARGVGEDEEIFAGEEEVTTKDKWEWSDKHRPRKPRYFNRVQMGFEWNKYNQTHYDQDNPPPKVVQGYKFNVFYPDLIDTKKAPTYKIERENGRKRGQTFAPAGEEDTCLVRFVAGPPYEDIAFRIVDKEWEYSAKRERGFRSSFDKGILQLHFQFKRIYYRK